MLIELTGGDAIEYIARRFGVPPGQVTATPLGGGVSNHVTLIQFPGQRFVLKQALSKLRVAEDWYSDRGRVFRESQALARIASLLPGKVPEIIFEDREQFAFAMSVAPGHLNWKSELMHGIVHGDVAEEIGRIHARMMRLSWKSGEWRGQFGDQTVFDQLRLDPYYRFTSRRHPDLMQYFESAIARCRENAVCLVHGDWSPKNMMVAGKSVMAIDFEVIHFGDPAFDCAFLLNHLLLKSFLRPESKADYARAAARYWQVVQHESPADAAWLADGTFAHLPLLLLARMDGKSPAEYINDESLKQTIRGFAKSLIAAPPADVSGIFQRIAC